MCLIWRDDSRFISAHARTLNGEFGHRQQSTHSGPTAHPIAAIRPVFYRLWAVATGPSFRLRSATQSIIGT